MALAATRVYEPSNRVADTLQTAAQRVGVLFWTSRARHGEMGPLRRLGTRWSCLNPCSDGGAACILLGVGVCSGKEEWQPPCHLETNAHRIVSGPYPTSARAFQGARIPGPGEAAWPSPAHLSDLTEHLYPAACHHSLRSSPQICHALPPQDLFTSLPSAWTTWPHPCFPWLPICHLLK